MSEPFRYRNPDGSLRLDELLGEKDVRHYTRILNSSSAEFRAMQLEMAVRQEVAEEAPATSWAWRAEKTGRMTEDGWQVSLEGAGDRVASSCTTVACRVYFSWDVCGYYRALGVHWRATKVEIARAAAARDPGRLDRVIAYASQQLLDPVIRRAYDLMPLGGLFVGDRDVQRQIEEAASREASRQNAQAWASGEAYDPEGRHHAVLQEWGFQKVHSAAEARERMSGTFRHGESPDELGASLSGFERHWGWYRLEDPYDGPQDPGAGVAALMESWQAMIANALTAAGTRLEFAVGIWQGHGVKVWRDSNQSCIVFFVERSQVTQPVANEAVRRVMAREDSRVLRTARR